MTETSPRFALPLLQAGQAQKEMFHNEALARIDALLHPAVASIATDTPPTSPIIGDAWIVGPGSSGAWAGKMGDIACWTGGGWRFLSPKAGLKVWLLDAGCWAWHDGSAWQSGALPSGGLLVDGIQVVGGRQGAIVTPSGGTTIDTEARGAIALILAAMRQHGLITT